MSRFTISPRTYQAVTFIALLALGAIVVTGGAVRLTGSGLGCPDWPTCTKDRLVAPVQYHAMIEFINRVITGLVSIAVIVAVLGSLFLKPRRRDLTLLSGGLVLGVIAQIVWGGLTVLFDLAPTFVAGHFIISIIIIADAVVLHWRAREYAGTLQFDQVTTDAPVRPLSNLMIAATSLAILLGTVVTGSGPHGGDEKAKRFDFVIGDVARLHGISVMLLIALTIYVAWLIRKEQNLHGLTRTVELTIAVMVAQAGIGYAQYFTGVPALLVGFHLLGAVLVWVAVVSFSLRVHASVNQRSLSKTPIATVGAASR